MLGTQCLLLVLAYLKASLCIEEDNLRNALNSIENRQRQLATNYYQLPSKDPERPLQLDDDNLMFLDSSPTDYDMPHHNRIGVVHKPSSKNFRVYDDDRLTDDDAEEYQKALNERLLEQLMLDMLKYEEEPAPAHRRPQKKSFFRERELNEISDNLQNLYPNAATGDGDDNAAASAFYAPTSFRERVKSKLHSMSPQQQQQLRHRFVKPPYEDEDGYDVDVVDAADYLNAVNPLWRRYDGFDPETLSEEDASLFLKYLTDKEFQEDDRDDRDDDFEPLTYSSEYRSRERRNKRYWLGSSSTKNTNKYSIRKRSADEKPFSAEKNVGLNKQSSNGSRANGGAATATAATTVANSSSAETNKSSGASPALVTATSKQQRSQSSPVDAKVVAKRGQQEVAAVDLMSLKPLNIKKKSVDWSNYFGVDKRSKKSNPTVAKEPRKNDVLLDQYIQSYILQSVRNSAFNNHGASSNSYRYLPKRDTIVGGGGSRRLETADDLRTAEDVIIDDVLKYTGAHEGINDPAALQRYRQKVIDELWVAYNLEKLRNELSDDEDDEKIVGGGREEAERTKKEHTHTNKKRVAVKKENAELVPTDAENSKKNKHNSTTSTHNTSKKNSIDYNKYRYDVSDMETCPVLNQIIDHCMQISHEVKDRDRTFAPYCTLHHICNICGAKQDSLSCDLSFFNDVTAICADEPVCRYTAERVLYLIQNQPATSYLTTKACDSCISQILPYNIEN